MAAEKKRLQYVDMIKGIAILWIVCYHLIAPNGPKNLIINHLMEVMLTSFFFFSGYFYRPGKRSIGGSIWNRAKSLLAPFFKYSLLFWVIGTVYLVATQEETIKEAFLCLRNFFVGCIWNRVIQDWFGWEYYSLGKRYFYLADFWFLIALLFASILFFLIADMALKSKAASILTAAALFLVTGLCLHFEVVLPYNLQIIPYWTAFLLLGAFFGQNRLFEPESLSRGVRWGTGLCLLAAGIVIALVKAPSLNQFRGTFGENEVTSMLLCIASAILVIWGMGLVCVLIETAGVRVKELAWLGSHSLLIYLFHMFFAWIIFIITGFSVRYEDPSPAGVIVKSVILTLMCIGLGILINILSDYLASKFKRVESAQEKVIR